MSKTAMKLALEALENAQANFGEWWPEAITALREALASEAIEQKSGIKQVIELYDSPDQPSQQEPVAMRYDFDGYGWKYIDSGSGSDWQTRIKDAEPIYITPPQRTWVGLTDEEVTDIWAGTSPYYHEDDFAKAIEAKLRERNT